MSFDIIGDIHGEAPTLRALLTKLGYRENGRSSYEHPSRKVIFLGDFVDRGAFQRDVITIAKRMCEAGNAFAVMGNHEFNAIAFARQVDGKYLRDRTWKNIKQHLEFLLAYDDYPDEYCEVIDWFQSLPLYLEFDDFRVVHACWDQAAVDRLSQAYSGPVLSDQLLLAASDKNRWEYSAIETLLKGREVPLPAGVSFLDKDRNPRHNIRVKWWNRNAGSYREAFLGPATARTHIPDDPVPGDHLIEYSKEEKPVFIGHYWLEGEPDLLAPNIACLDFSVAKKPQAGSIPGKLCAYRWDGTTPLSPGNLLYVHRIPDYDAA